jgi:hypothetical protein
MEISWTIDKQTNKSSREMEISWTIDKQTNKSLLALGQLTNLQGNGNFLDN